MQDILTSLYEYCDKHTTLPDHFLHEIERATHLQTLAPRMLSGHLQGSLLSMISKIVAPKHILEIGTFTGYSAIALAQGLANDGLLTTIEYNPEHAAIANRFFDRSAFADRIRLLVGDAKELITLMDTTFDLVFIDADKEAYSLYFDLIIDKCRTGAIIIADNVLWSGKVLDKDKDKKTKLIDQFNAKIMEDERVENVILPIRDGITLIRKR
jgi:predicted O-methyltransferase YrrM